MRKQVFRITSDTSSIWTSFWYEPVKSETSKFIATLSWMRILPSKWKLWPTTLSKIDWYDPCLNFSFYVKTKVYRINELRCKFCLNQRWPESLFQTPIPLLYPNFLIRFRVWLFFKFENPTPVRTPATIIDATVIYPCFYLRNNHTDSCYCRNWKLTLGPVFPKFLTPGLDPGPNEKRRILPESTPVIRIRSHLWFEPLPSMKGLNPRHQNLLPFCPERVYYH